jgi:hypothetical protein
MLHKPKLKYFIIFFLLDNPFGYTNHEWTLGQTLAKDSTNFLKQCALYIFVKDENSNFNIMMTIQKSIARCKILGLKQSY